MIIVFDIFGVFHLVKGCETPFRLAKRAKGEKLELEFLGFTWSVFISFYYQTVAKGLNCKRIKINK